MIEFAENAYPIFKTIISFLSEGREKSEPIFITNSKILQPVPNAGLTMFQVDISKLFKSTDVTLGLPTPTTLLGLMDTFDVGEKIFIDEIDEGRRYCITNGKFQIKAFKPYVEGYSPMNIEDGFPGEVFSSHEFNDNDVKSIKKVAKTMAARQYTYAVKDNKLCSISINDNYFYNISDEKDADIYKGLAFFPFPSNLNTKCNMYKFNDNYFLEFKSNIGELEIQCITALTKKMYNVEL